MEDIEAISLTPDDGRYEIQTTYGYPSGTWGFHHAEFDRSTAIRFVACKDDSDEPGYRVFDRRENWVLFWPGKPADQPQ